MDAYWDSVVAPALAAVRPRAIVEIGSEHGYTTRKAAFPPSPSMSYPSPAAPNRFASTSIACAMRAA